VKERKGINALLKKPKGTNKIEDGEKGKR